MTLDEQWESAGLVGKVVAGRYQVTSELGASTRCTLYKAEHLEQHTEVVLAVVSAQGPAPEQRLRKAETLRSLDHPALVAVLDAGTLESGELYVATEWPGAGSLGELIAGKPLEQRRALRIACEVLDAVAALHAVGEVHGDIQPGTIFVTTGLGKDRIKLGEVGVGTLTGGKKPGDPHYAAPESALAIGSIDARADIYAVGAVLFELLTGRPPFFAHNPESLRRLHAYAPLQTLEQRAPDVAFADAIETIVATALAKKRDARFHSAREMIEALDRALAELKPAAPLPSAERVDVNDDSIWRIAEELKKQVAPADDAANIPLVPANVGRQVPELPLHTRARQRVSRTLDRVSARVGVSRRNLLGGLAAVAGIGLILAIGMCAGSTRTQPATASETRAPEAATPPVAASKPVTLDDRCEQLGTACGASAKHVVAITAQCKQAAKRQIDQGCTDAAISTYDCYETKLCGKGDVVWALDDLRVLAERHTTCLAETNAVRACAGHP